MKRLLLLALTAGLISPIAANASHYLVLQYYKQANKGSARNPRVADYSSPGITVIPMESRSQCITAGEELMESMYKPVKFFDGRYRCIEGK